MARIWNKHKQTNTPLKRKVFVAMSGGVDSSVAALLLKRRGFEVVGVFMRCWHAEGSFSNCSAERDAEDARRVAGRLEIPFYIWNFENEYRRRVVDYMVDGYRHGITPNPDVMCNREIKFGLFLKRALEMGADYVATGHYVKVQSSKIKDQNEDSKFKYIYKLFEAKDKNKDQSYFLWTLTQKQLRYCLFPIGDYMKPEVRAIARRAGLPTAAKKDSQGICFIGKISLKDFLKDRIPARRGNIITTSGAVIGQHEGAEFYTIGQRHGFNLSDKRPRTASLWGRQATKNKDGRIPPFYIAEKDVKKNIITVAESSSNPALYKKELLLADANFVFPIGFKLKAQKSELCVMARVRYRQQLAPATLRVMRSNPEQPFLIFAKPQKFVATGQSAIWYSKRGELLGGGVIIDSH